MQCHRNRRKDSNQREIRTQRSLRGEIEATSPSNLQRKQRQPLKGKTWELFILNAIILVVEGILSRSKPDSERQDTGAVKCVNRTVYAVFVDSEKAFWNHYIKFLCFSLSRQCLRNVTKGKRKDMTSIIKHLGYYPIQYLQISTSPLEGTAHQRKSYQNWLVGQYLKETGLIYEETNKSQRAAESRNQAPDILITIFNINTVSVLLCESNCWKTFYIYFNEVKQTLS